jgi:Protein of unknown function (DUF4232)
MKPIMAVIALAAGVFATACGSSSTPSPVASASSPTATVALPSPTPSATPTATAIPVACDFTWSLSDDDYSGHSVVIVKVTNSGASACQLFGYPTVQLKGPGGTVTTIAQANTGGQAATATPSAVPVAVGGAAQFIVELTNVPAGANNCVNVTSLAFQLPNGGSSVTLPWSQKPCPPTFYVGAITPTS